MTKVAKLQKDNKSLKYTLESGRKIEIKPLTLEVRDELMDEVEYVTDDKGTIKGVSAMQKTISKWLRGLLVSGTSDQELLAWTMQERVEAFGIMQKHLLLGEEKPST